MAPVRADGCWSPARVADLVWGACSYTTPELPCTGGCGTRGVCFFGRCRCAPGAMRAVGGGCESGGAVPLVCKVFKTKYPVKGSRTYDADQCLVHPEYGSAVIPSKRWLAAQAAEAELWRRGGDKGSHAGVGDRAQSHVERFDRYRMLPRDLGKVAEVGAGPWTQTYFALRARPDVRLSSLTVIDPGIPGYLAAGKSTYQNGSMATGAGHTPVHLLPVGAEQVPKNYHGSFDTVVMINCVEHTFNAFATLYSAHSLLRPGGTFVFQERSVKLASGAQLYHPVRLNKRFFDWWLDTLYVRTFSPSKHMRLKHFMEAETYFIGRKK